MDSKHFMKRLSVGKVSKFLHSIIEYETPKVVKVHNPGIGLLRRGLQLAIVLYVGLYQLYYARGYQEFAGIESSVTTKVKGYSMSVLGEGLNINHEMRRRYERVWDEADYVIPPAENGAFFVTTNVIITPNQTWGTCPEDPRDIPSVICNVSDPTSNSSSSCTRNSHLHKSHGPQTGRCVRSDRQANVSVCEISSWCPVEDDRLLLGNKRPLITGSQKHTAFIKNSIRFSHFGDRFHRNNMPHGICVYNFSDPATHLCPIFRLGDIVEAAGGNYTKMSVKGGVVAIHISWICNLDFDFMKNCLPKYNFRLLDTYGWNFRHAHFHEEGRRTLYKAYGIKFVIIVQGRAGKFDLKNTVINIVAGLGLLSFITMFCDFILLHYVEESEIVKQKKFEILDRNQVLSGLLNIMAVTNTEKQAMESSECLLQSSKQDKGSQWEVNKSEHYPSYIGQSRFQSEERLLCGKGLDDGRKEKEKRDEKEEENFTHENAKEGEGENKKKKKEDAGLEERYRSLEYIDGELLSRNGWTHHRVSSGKLSLHIVSQV